MANVPIYLNQGGTVLTIGEGGTLDTTDGVVDIGPFAIGPDGVATVNIQDDAVTTDKIDDEAVTTAKLGLLAVDTAQLADSAVDTDKIALEAVGTDNIADEAVTKAKANVFISANQTGTQTMIAHDLGVDPTAANVILSPISTSGTDVPGVYAVVIATDATNISVTVTGGALVYRVFAWAP